MEKYIKAQEEVQDNNGEGLKAFERIQVLYTPTGSKKPSYPKVKKWFLKTYREYKAA